MIPVIVRGAIDEPSWAAIEAEVAGHTTLERVVAWGLAQSPPRMIAAVVKQDEYTQDVVLPIEGGRFLVYDST